MGCVGRRVKVAINCIQASRVSVSCVVHRRHLGTESEHPKSWIAAISLSPWRELWYYLAPSSNIWVKGDKMRRENNPIRLPLETWCSLSVPKCTASNKGNCETLDACIPWYLIKVSVNLCFNVKSHLQLHQDCQYAISQLLPLFHKIVNLAYRRAGKPCQTHRWCTKKGNLFNT